MQLSRHQPNGHSHNLQHSMIRLRDFDNRGFDRGASRWKEAIWILVKALFFLNPLPWPNLLRVAMLRMFGARVGERVVVRAQVNVSFPWRLTLGDDVWLGEACVLLTLAPVVVESDVCISQRVFLCTGSHDFRKEAFDLVTRPITIRRGSWIAAEAFVAAGVEVGEGSLVSAGSVVFEDVPPRSLVRGNPAVVVKTLD
jgi:putative colanic acid biosynthesis acetyltransferase WcaF